MAKTYPELDDVLTRFIQAQSVFFVATAPLAAEGHVNLSPKGLDTFRILGPKTVAYLDIFGSGVETIAHLRENGRIVIMLCAFTGPPRILRLHGRGEAIEPQDAGFSQLYDQLRQPELREPGIEPLAEAAPPLRSVIRVEIQRISDSCGYGVPLYEFEADRTQLTRWAAGKGTSGLRDYQRAKNARSLDGLPGLRWVEEEELPL